MEKDLVENTQKIKTEKYTHHKELTKIAKGAGITFSGRIAGSAFQYAYSLIIARFLGAESFGLFFLGLGVTKILEIVSRIGLDNGALRYIAIYNGIKDFIKIKRTIVQSLVISTIVSIAIALLLMICANPISLAIFNNPDLSKVLRLFSLSLPFITITMISLSIIQGFQKMQYRVYVENLFNPISKIMLSVLFFILGWQLRGIILAYIISAGLGMVLACYFLKDFFPRVKLDSNVFFETNKLLRFSSPLLLIALLILIMLWTDTLMLGYFRSLKEVGIYAAAGKTALLVILILDAFNSIFVPIIADLYSRGESKKLENLFKTVTKWIFSLSFIIFLFVLLFSKEVMHLFGPGFMSGWSCLIILAFSQLVNASVGSVGYILVMTGRQNTEMYNTIGICIVNIILNLILIPHYGMIGAAIATSASIICINIIKLIEVYYYQKMHPYNRKFLKGLLVGLISFIVMIYFKNKILIFNSIFGLILAALLFAFAFLGLLILLGLDKEDRIVLEIIMNKLVSIKNNI